MSSLALELEVVARRYRGFAIATHEQSDCYEEWSGRLAADVEVLTWLSTLPYAKHQPNLVFAAARWHGVTAPGPYEGLRAALLGDDGTVRETILTRSTQTNEVGRLATLVPAFTQIAASASGPLALLEIGTSAGLCLYPDRYDYAWPPLGALTGSGGPTLTSEAEGPLPVPERSVPVAWRGGIDLHPLDVTDDDAMAWLETLVWPEQEERRARLRAAIEVARAAPPEVVQGDLFDELGQQVERARAYGTVVVFHSAVAMYLDRQRREDLVALMTGLVVDGACHWVSNEQRDILPSILPQLGATSPATPDSAWARLSFVLGVDGRAVALTHQHGAGIRWL